MPSTLRSCIVFFGLVLMLSHTAALARPISAEKRELIDIIIEQTGASKFVPLMTGQLTNEIITLLQSKDVTVDRNLATLIQKEAKTVMYEEFILSNKFNDIFYELYDEYFTAKQLKVIAAFYESTAGSRILKVMPDISRRSMELAQEHSQGIGLKVQQRLMKRFDEAEKRFEASEIKEKINQQEPSITE